MADSLTFEDELTIEESGWATRAITAGAALLIVAFSAAAVWYFAFRDEETVVRATENIPVAKKTINTTVLVSGVADAELNSRAAWPRSTSSRAMPCGRGRCLLNSSPTRSRTRCK
jgi:hypothetical protein